MADIRDSDGSAAVEFQPASESAFDADSNLGAEFSRATIDARASIREGMQSADLELAALADLRANPLEVVFSWESGSEPFQRRGSRTGLRTAAA